MQTMYPRPITVNVCIYIFSLIIVQGKSVPRAIAQIADISMHTSPLAGEQTN